MGARLFIVLATLWITPLCLASESSLDRWLSWDALTASFIQREYDASGTLTRTSEGVLTLKRPNYALWQVRTPDPQEFYANALGVWHYDPWLEVATFHPIDSDGSQVTLALFSGDKSILEQRYAVTESEDQVLLSPRDNDSQIQTVSIILSLEGYPRSIELQTSLGHRSLIELNNVKIGQFPPEMFEFTPPPGTEIQ
ncbi:MAG: outer membrane lipoprotein chaperone LolA [Halieaceae bacterium]|nr:outer membrane lipoprotein chaperone LolA [Halieaceae bacterium]